MAWLQIALAATCLVAATRGAVLGETRAVANSGGVTIIGGKPYACRCYVGDNCWPSAAKWAALNGTVDGTLLVDIPPGAPCHNTFNGPLGTVPTYNAASCADVQANYGNEQWTTDRPAAVLWSYFSNDTCRPTTNPTDTCTLGYYPVYVILATKKEHIKAGIDFARMNNIRLIIRNTGHDFIGRSTGWGSLVINTHSFQDITWISNYAGPGSYRGSAVKLGAGVQGRAFLRLAHARDPPLAVVTGECPTVGIAGGFVQGGGHGPWTTLKGLAADNVLEFEAITASGRYVVANAIDNPDLFWALKGGGPASYSVVLSVTVQTFPDVQSSGAVLYINATHTTDPNVLWEGVRTFHKWPNHFVDSGLYVYFTVRPGTFRARPFVGIGKTALELNATIQPLLDELDSKGVPYEYSVKQFPTFFDLYIDLFEDEGAGQAALTGGWMFNHDDVANRNDQIIDAFKTVLAPRSDVSGFIIGHLFDPGHNVPVANSARHPAWANATNLVISSFLVPFGVSLAQKADLQNLLTNTVDAALRNASRSGCAYVNEADPNQPDWQSHFWGSNYPRLKLIRKLWDPLGVFYAVSTPGTEDWVQLPDGTKLCRKLF